MLLMLAQMVFENTKCFIFLVHALCNFSAIYDEGKDLVFFSLS